MSSPSANTPDRLYSFEEYLTLEDTTDNRYELVEGRLDILKPATFRHLLITKFIEQVFDEEIDRLHLNWLCLKEAGIRTGWRKSRYCDLYVIQEVQILNLLEEAAISQVPPLLAVEIVSPESAVRDYRYKRSEYAALEIPEYWLVDSMQQRVSVLLLEDGWYEETVFVENQPILSRTFPKLALTVQQVLRAGILN